MITNMITKRNWNEVHSKQSYRFSNKLFSNYFILKRIFTKNINHFRRFSTSFVYYLKQNFARQLYWRFLTKIAEWKNFCCKRTDAALHQFLTKFLRE